MELEQAIKNALDGDAILFLGSGASLGATNLEGNTMASASKLSDKIFPDCEDLQQAVDLFLSSRSCEEAAAKSELISLLKREFTCQSITPQQEALAMIPWKRIYTTNYDNVIEKAYLNCSKQIKSVVTTDDAKKNLSGDETLCVHINGYIYKLDIEALNSSFKLSETSYNTEAFSGNSWGQLFKTDMQAYSTIIFIGFSMKKDIDIRRMVSRVNNKKCVFIVDKDENKNNITSLEKYGRVYNIGLKGFIDAFDDVKTSYSPIDVKTVDNTFLTNFKIRNIQNFPMSVPKDEDVLKYYTRGKHNDDLYFEKGDGYYAVVKRSYVENIVNDIHGGCKAIFIHSDIGNGKTEIIEQICRELHSEYKIYEVIDKNEKLTQEIELICNTNKKTVIIIENLFNYYDVFQNFQLFDTNGNIIYLFTARTSLYKSRYESFEINPIKVYDLNKLKNDEIKSLCSIFQEYGYYLSDLKDNETQIKSDCGSRLQSILLTLFEHNNIAQELEIIVEKIFSPEFPQYKLILFLMIIKVMSLNIGFSDALNLTEEYSVSYDLQKDCNVSEFFDWKDGVPSIKSVAMCVWVLTHNNLIKDIFDILVDTAKVADKAYSIVPKYEDHLANIISYKHLRFIMQLLEVNDDEKRNIINNFYERIKNLNYYNNKYYFWLQYAISSLEVKDYSGAKMHFKAAYANLPSNMEPFEINNQYARLLIECMLLEEYQYNSKTIEEIEEIDRLLTPTKEKADEQYYSYKMAAAYYGEIFRKFFKSFSPKEKDVLNDIVINKFNACNKYLKSNRNMDFVNNVEKFSKTFLCLSCFEDNKNDVDFILDSHKGPHMFGHLFKDGKKERAHLFNNGHKCTCIKGAIYKATIIKYDNNYNCWELILDE